MTSPPFAPGSTPGLRENSPISRCAVAPGAAIVLEGVGPFDGPLAVRLGVKVLHLGRRLAAAVHVAADEGALAEAATAPPRRPARRRNG